MKTVYELPPGYLDLLIQKRYSKSTITTYTNYFRQFADNFQNQDLDSICVQDINSYILELIRVQCISASQQNQRINSIKFYYEQVLGRTKEYYHINRPKKESKLPTVPTLGRLRE